MISIISSIFHFSCEISLLNNFTPCVSREYFFSLHVRETSAQIRSRRNFSTSFGKIRRGRVSYAYLSYRQEANSLGMVVEQRSHELRDASTSWGVDVHGIWCMLSTRNLSSFRDGKGNVCFLILTCHLCRWIMYAVCAHVCVYRRPAGICYSSIGTPPDTTFTALFVTFRFLFSVLRRSWG